MLNASRESALIDPMLLLRKDVLPEDGSRARTQHLWVGGEGATNINVDGTFGVSGTQSCGSRVHWLDKSHHRVLFDGRHVFYLVPFAGHLFNPDLNTGIVVSECDTGTAAGHHRPLADLYLSSADGGKEGHRLGARVRPEPPNGTPNEAVYP